MKSNGTSEKRPLRRSMTASILRLARHMGFLPTRREIAEGCACLPQEVAMVLREERHTRYIQEAVAKWAGMTVRQLFGSASWHLQKKARPVNLAQIRRTARVPRNARSAELRAGSKAS